MTDTALRSDKPAGPALASGNGGGGWADGDDDDPDGWWGWSEEPADDEPPYRGSRLRRVVAVVTAAAVVTGSMTLLAVAVVGPAAPQYAVASVRLATPASSPGGITQPLAVRFVVTNTSSVAGRATCRVLVGNPSDPLATATVTTPWLHGGSSAAELARVSVDGPPRGRVAARCGAVGGT